MKKFIALTVVLLCASIANAHYRTARISFFTAPVIYTPAPLVAQYTLPVQGGCCGGTATQSIQSFRIEPIQGVTPQNVTVTQPVRTERVETVTQSYTAPVVVQQGYASQQIVGRQLAITQGYAAPFVLRERVRVFAPVRVAEFRVNPVIGLGVRAVNVVVPRRFVLQIGRRFSLRF